MQLVEGTDIFLPHLFLGISNENNAVYTFQDKFSCGVIFDLAGHGIQLNFQFVSFDLPHVEGQKIKEQGAISMGLQADHLRLDLFGEFSVDIFKVGGLAAPAGAVIDDLHLNDFFSEIDKAQSILLLPVKLIAKGKKEGLA